MTLAHSPAAERNRQPILDQLAGKLPASGTVLEVASGSGQHVAWFAAALPQLEWQPSDIDDRLFESVRARINASGLGNVAAPIELDVTHRPWPVTQADAVLCINMIHIAPWDATLGLLEGAATVLSSGSMLHLYGPFSQAGQHTAPSNAAFDAALRGQHESWGVRDLDVVATHAAEHGFEAPEAIDMPANNLLVSFRLS